MSEEHDEEMFEKNVQYLAKQIPPDDIYIFAEGLLAMSYYFLRQWGKYTDIQEECDEDEITYTYVVNLLRYFYSRDMEMEVKYRMGFYTDNNERK